MVLQANTGKLFVTGEICANAFSATPTCLASGGFGTGQKICIGGSRTISWQAIINAPSSWTPTDCAEWHPSQHSSLGFVFQTPPPGTTDKFSWGAESGGYNIPVAPSPNCGW